MDIDTTAPRPSRRRWIALFAVLLGQFMLVLDATVVNVALPAMQADLHLPQAQLTWITNAYLIAFGGFLLLFGRLGDLLGRRRIFLLGLGVFTLASAACGLTHDATTLIAARFLQGIGAAASAAVVLAIVAIEFPEPAERTRAMSGYMFVSVSGSSVGLLLGGALTQMVDWHWIFLINIPIGLFGIPLGRAVLRESPAPGIRNGVDVTGAIMVTAAAMLAVYALVEGSNHAWTSGAVLVPAAIALITLALFFVLEARIANPILPLRILRVRSLMVTSVVRGFMIMGMYAVFFFGSLELAQTAGFGPLDVGLAFLPMTATVGILSLGLSARLVARFGAHRVLLGGMALIALALLSFAHLSPSAPYWPWRFGSYTLLGLGAGNSFLPLLTIAMSEVPSADAGLGSSIVNLSQQLSAAVDLALLATAASQRTDHLRADHVTSAEALVGGYHFAYTLAAIGVLAGLTVAALFLRPRPRPREQATPLSSSTV
ncbi:MFS transporter [Pendulispora albinea]|uniref:MFS transporter n=1 Tax=Pendulispora albinea TaxID=2741071 RepID=A0ABZ2M2R6_9BACT